MNRRRYDSGRFEKSSDSYNRKEYPRKSSNFKDDFRGRYHNSSKYFDDSKYSSGDRHSYKTSSSRSGEDHRMKRSRNDDSRLSSSYMSNHRRNDIRPKTPPPPTIRSSGSSYARGSTHRNNDSSRHTSSYRNTYSPSRRRQGFNGPRGTTQRYNPRLRAPVRRDSDARPRIIRRKIIVSSSRKFNSLRNDRSRIIRLAKIKRTRDSLKSKTSSSKKSSRENDSDDDENETKKSDREKSENIEEKSAKENDPDEEKEEEDGENDETKEKKEKPSKDVEKSKKTDEDSSRKRRSAKRESVTPERKPKPFIKLVCVHCKIKCRTFNEYQHHLYNKTHRMAMRRISIRQKTQLSKMRLDQRKAQKELEENTKEDLGDQQYCLLCRLNYKTGKAKHQISDHHKTMKKFLMPYCSTCHIAFKSPTVYQSHRCSLEHIKRKARDNKSDTDDSENEMQVDLKDFTTVDSIGEIDDDDINGSADEDISELDDESMGLKFVKKVEALYCEKCENYISHDLTNEEEITLKHCKTKLHLKLTRKAAAKAREEEMAAEENEPKEDSKLEEDGVKDELEDEEMPAEKSTAEDNEDDENDENILNIDILSEKNGKENEIIDDAANNTED